MDVATKEKNSTQVKGSDFPIIQEIMTPMLASWIHQTPVDMKNLTLDCLTLLPTELVKIGFETAKTPTSLFMFGEYGCGKTTFAYATIREILKYNTHLFARVFSSKKLDSILCSAREKGKDWEYAEIETLSEIDVLFIDDLDKVYPSEQFRSNFFEIINCRMQSKKITIITSNLDISNLGNLIDGAVVSRLYDRRYWKILSFPKKDLRIGDIATF